MVHSVAYSVLKLGGSVLADADNIANAVQLIKELRSAGTELAVVVSAMGRTTKELDAAGLAAAQGKLDQATTLIEGIRARATGTAKALANRDGLDLGTLDTEVDKALSPVHELLQGVHLVRELSPATRDRILAFGELISAITISRILNAAGLQSTFVDSRRWTVTNAQFGSAEVLWDSTQKAVTALLPELHGLIAVHTGFLGATTDGRPTTLGRNGSDYTATLLARATHASSVVVWTDVSGVMTADPDWVPEAYPVGHLSYDEAIELSRVGLGILHPRTMLPLVHSGIPLLVRNLTKPNDPGTRVDQQGSTDGTRPACITSLANMALLDVQASLQSEFGVPASKVLDTLNAQGISVWLEAQAVRGAGIAILVEASAGPKALSAIERTFATEIADGLLLKPKVQSDVTLITLVGQTMGQNPNVAGRFYSAMGSLGINVLASAQGASSRAVSAVVRSSDATLAVRSIHSAFNLARDQISVFLLGKGTVGKQLLHQVQAEQQRLADRHDVSIHIVGVADSKNVLFSDHGLELGTIDSQMTSAEPNKGILGYLDRLKVLPLPILVDCTAEDHMESIYAAAFERGIHVVAANKKPLASSIEVWRSIQSSARSHHRNYRYETTVGASLPVIETLKNLVRTGDVVRRVEGSLSGTLGYLTNELMRGVPLSKAVRTAKDLGYTEPHPADDLSGIDAARKALILSRELGLTLNFSDVHIAPLVPAEILAERDLDAFFNALQRYDETMAGQIAEMKKTGSVLRYLVEIEPGDNPRLSVGPITVASDHPATRLRGSESFLAFYTERYAEYPLVVQGAGAGGAVTAAGVLADILAVAQGLRSR